MWLLIYRLSSVETIKRGPNTGIRDLIQQMKQTEAQIGIFTPRITAQKPVVQNTFWFTMTDVTSPNVLSYASQPDVWSDTYLGQLVLLKSFNNALFSLLRGKILKLNFLPNVLAIHSLVPGARGAKLK